jgi:hypothetical protein
MATNRVRGTSQMGAAIDAALYAEWKAWVSARGETQRQAIEMALRRHMAYPPSPPAPPAVEPFPDEPAAKKRPKK